MHVLLHGIPAPVLSGETEQPLATVRQWISHQFTQLRAARTPPTELCVFVTGEIRSICSRRKRLRVM